MHIALRHFEFWKKSAVVRETIVSDEYKIYQSLPILKAYFLLAENQLLALLIYVTFVRTVTEN